MIYCANRVKEKLAKLEKRIRNLFGKYFIAVCLLSHVSNNIWNADESKLATDNVKKSDLKIKITSQKLFSISWPAELDFDISPWIF